MLERHLISVSSRAQARVSTTIGTIIHFMYIFITVYCDTFIFINNCIIPIYFVLMFNYVALRVWLCILRD